MVIYKKQAATEVALHVRAWVEIHIGCMKLKVALVALHVRAWVEICAPYACPGLSQSPSM